MAAVLLTLIFTRANATVYYVNTGNTSPLFPFTTWATAATNIQDAIGVAGSGDTVLVTNGIYAYGGAIMAGDLVNRVAITNAVTVQSVNGPWATTILGAGAVNGPAAVRCAWLTNGASLNGFTLTGGATRSSGDTTNLESGGGAWCSASAAYIRNCIIASNAAASYGGAVLRGTVSGSLICSNTTSAPSGGAVNQAVIANCTIISNATYGVVNPQAMTNCIIYYNSPGNWTVGAIMFHHCCSVPLLLGGGNFTNAPQLFADGVHLATNSPCIGTGLNPAPGTDIYGMTWSNPPAIGCAESEPMPLAGTPQVTLSANPPGFYVGNAPLDGQSPFTFTWLKGGQPLTNDGHFNSTQTSSLLVTGLRLSDADAYQLVVRNTFGVVTSAVAQVVIHAVNAAGANPVAPYTNWFTAATNIQDAINVAAAGEIVLVTNGTYASGGLSMDATITNRVTVNKAVLVQGANGAANTVISGAWDPVSTNGPGAIRCAWLTNNAILSGFTLCNGATRASITNGLSLNGGGAWGSTLAVGKPPGGTVANCILSNNVAANFGAGAYQVVLNNCLVCSNLAVGGSATSGSGGGAYGCNLVGCTVMVNSATGSGGGLGNCSAKNCAITRNVAVSNGGGAYLGSLVNCTVTKNRMGNSTSGYGGGVSGSSLTNCVVYFNSATANPSTSNSYNSVFSYSCIAPAASGTGNIASDPLLLADAIHLAANSPCLGEGNPGAVSGTDIDGQPWNNPPAIGCDEWQPVPLMVQQPVVQVDASAHALTFDLVVAGQLPFVCAWTKDGVLLQDDGHHLNSTTANLVVNQFGLGDAGVYQVVVTNAVGAVTSAVVQVVIHAVSAAGVNPVPPYTTWATAATNIQDAVNVAGAGDIVLVTNGVYASGGAGVAGSLTNRVALTLPITVLSANGFGPTMISGAWDPLATNGPGAVRCAYVADGAVLAGFTLANGATLAAGDADSGGPLESGGGVWCNSTNGIVENCVLTNDAAIYGGGLANGTLNNSLVLLNIATYGGGTYAAALNNCTVVNNFARGFPGHGGGTYNGVTRNCIVYGNIGIDSLGASNPQDDTSSSGSALYYNSCTSGVPGNSGLSGTANITADPEFLDLYHISADSPCVGAGNAAYVTGVDLDGETWNNPPAMGCSEVVQSNMVGPLTVAIFATQASPLVGRYDGLAGTIDGRASYVQWSFGDGQLTTNSGADCLHQWTNAGNYTVTLTAYNNDHPGGVTASMSVNVQALLAPQIQPAAQSSNGFQFQFNAQSNANYIIQYATNLAPPISWQTLQMLYYSPGGVVQINDAAATNGFRFYRVGAQ